MKNIKKSIGVKEYKQKNRVMYKNIKEGIKEVFNVLQSFPALKKSQNGDETFLLLKKAKIGLLFFTNQTIM